jgi:type I site-specific restriction endonuclease
MMFGDRFPPYDSFRFGRATVATIQTFCRRLDDYQQGFDLIILDECHRSAAAQFKDTVDTLLRYNPNARVLGLTATPTRADEQSLAAVFPGRVTPDGVQPNFAFQMETTDAIDLGYLVDPVCIQGEMKGVDPSVWKVRTNRSTGEKEFTESSLEQSMSDGCIDSIAHEVLAKGKTTDGRMRKGILFLPGIGATDSVFRALNKLRPGCAVRVHGDMPEDEAEASIRMIEDSRGGDGEVLYICGCDKLIEGFDVPDISLVVMARFTASVGRYLQMLGRGLRVFPGCIDGLFTASERRAAIASSPKKDCMVIDYANSSRFGMGPVPISLHTAIAASKHPERLQFYREVEAASGGQPQSATASQNVREWEVLWKLHQAVIEYGQPPVKAEFAYWQKDLRADGGVTRRVDNRQGTAKAVQKTVNEYVSYYGQAQKEAARSRAEQMTESEVRKQIESLRETRKTGGQYRTLVEIGFSHPEITAGNFNYHDVNFLFSEFKRSGNRRPADWNERLNRFRANRKRG